MGVGCLVGVGFIQFCPPFSDELLWLETSDLVSLCLSFLGCKAGIRILLTSLGWPGDRRREAPHTVPGTGKVPCKPRLLRCGCHVAGNTEYGLRVIFIIVPLLQQFLIGGNFDFRGILTMLGDILVVITRRRRHHWHLMGGGLECCQRSFNAQE